MKGLILLLFSFNLAATSFDEFIANERQWLSKQLGQAQLLNAEIKPLRVLKNKQRDPMDFSHYVAQYLTDKQTQSGLACLDEYQSLLNQLTKKYAIPKHILCALFALDRANSERLDFYPSTPFLAALAWQQPQTYLQPWRQYLLAAERSPRAFTQISRSLRFKHIPITLDNLAPLKYLGDSKELATPHYLTMWAKYLTAVDWQVGIRWGRQVKANNGAIANLDISKWHTLAHWRQLGVTKFNNKALPKSDLEAKLIILDKLKGRQYLVYKNYNLLEKLYNDQYFAFAVVILGDRLLYHQS
ncbi:lytic murein transglycosylase [Paraferrimonas sp. SM1919]|uniref:lytic murein transglycosylase n=1 Tax=Paraferrimonas sp. SM1919 TaxID=2662263 RepID=UPI0013D31D92|nr:lytic murein transglycosylase [Paraferrimonas sp. SM1919]